MLNEPRIMQYDIAEQQSQSVQNRSFLALTTEPSSLLLGMQFAFGTLPMKA
jgi:hypothetical protein